MPPSHPNPDLIALGVRQPWAELIMRGVKTVEVRSVETNVRGPIYIYSAKKLAEIPPAATAGKRFGMDLESLPRGVVVGAVEIADCQPGKASDASAACVPRAYLKGQFGWRLTHPQRWDEPLVPRFLPYGIWFYPWKRRTRTSPGNEHAQPALTTARCVLTVTPSNLKYHHLYLGDAIGMFPADVIGGSSTAEAAPRSLCIQWAGEDVIRTDIVGNKRIFRKRGWLARFYNQFEITAGDQVVLERLDEYRFSLRPVTVREVGVDG